MGGVLRTVTLHMVWAQEKVCDGTVMDEPGTPKVVIT